MKVQEVPIKQIQIGYNPRIAFEAVAMEELKTSIKTYGILVPLKVRPTNNDGKSFELIYGERRLRAARDIGLKTVPCIVEEVSDKAAIIEKGVENIARGNLHYLEEGSYFAQLLDKDNHIFEKQDDIAKAFGIAQQAIASKLVVHNGLYDDVKAKILPFMGKPVPINGKGLPINCAVGTEHVGLTHALALADLHHQRMKINDAIVESITSEELRQVISGEFIAKCQDAQLALCTQTIDEHLTVKKLSTRIETAVKAVKDALQNRITEERQKACNSYDYNELRILSYNKDCRLLANDYKPELDIPDVRLRCFGPVGLIVTSPPYFVGKEFDTESWDQHLELLRSSIESCAGVLLPGSKFCVNVADPVIEVAGKKTEHLIMPYIVSYMERVGLQLFARIIWDKGGYWANAGYAVDIQSSHTEYKVMFNWEYVFVFRKQGKVQRAGMEDISNRLNREEWEQCVDAVWDIPSVSRNKTDKDAKYPEELVRRLIRMYSYENDTVLDPFSGNGTTARVAVTMGRNAIAYEINEDIWKAQCETYGHLSK
jgi:ParB/RepB/Spo0J family partition protein